MPPMGKEYGASLMAIMERGNTRGNTQGARARPGAEPEETRSEETREHHQPAPVKERPEESTAAAMLGDPRYRRWMWRIGVGVVAFVAVLIIASWKLGLVVAILVVVGDSFRQSRKSSTVTAWQKSSAAERRTE